MPSNPLILVGCIRMGQPTRLRGSVQTDRIARRDNREDHPAAGHPAQGRQERRKSYGQFKAMQEYRGGLLTDQEGYCVREFTVFGVINYILLFLFIWVWSRMNLGFISNRYFSLFIITISPNSNIIYVKP